MTQRLGLIGYGGIGQSILTAWTQRPIGGYRMAVLLVRPRQRATAQAAWPDLAVTDSVADFLGHRPDIVIEAAGQPAVRETAEAALAQGCDYYVISTGALADPDFRARIQHGVGSGPGRVIIPVGATAGLDGLLAMRQDGLLSVTYTSTKPPKAWRGTPAEQAFDLDAIAEPTVIFAGRADQAALQYPKNANLAATVALAGLGFEHTQVRLVADPAATGNTGRIEAESASSRLSVTVAGRSSASNPKTSAITGMSVLAALENRQARFTFG